jgi:hypothetical protein
MPNDPRSSKLIIGSLTGPVGRESFDLTKIQKSAEKSMRKPEASLVHFTWPSSSPSGSELFWGCSWARPPSPFGACGARAARSTELGAALS